MIPMGLLLLSLLLLTACGEGTSKYEPMGPSVSVTCARQNTQGSGDTAVNTTVNCFNDDSTAEPVVVRP